MNPQPAGFVSIHLLFTIVALTTTKQLAPWLFWRGLLDCCEAPPEHAPVEPPALCWRGPGTLLITEYMAPRFSSTFIRTVIYGRG
jgi:hypothetical protein